MKTLLALAFAVLVTHGPQHEAVSEFAILTDGKLAEGYDLGVDTSEQQRDWVETTNGYLRCKYPRGQKWGAVFIAVGQINPDVDSRQSKDLTPFRYLVLEARGLKGGERASVGMKAKGDPDSGQEPKYRLHLSKDWKRFKIALSKFTDDSYSRKRLRSTYIPFELVFEPSDPSETIDVKNVRVLAE